MKTNKVTRSLSILLMLLLFIPAGFAKSWGAKETKEVNHRFAWKAEDLLQVNNKYGEISVVHWDKKEISLRIVVEVKANDQETARRTLNRITFQFADADHVLSANTRIADNNGRNEQVQFNIRYYINLPADARCDLNQKYGNIIMLEEHRGDCRIDARYGNIELGNLKGNLDLVSKYGDVKTGNLANAQFELGYCGQAELESGKNIRIDGKYSSIRFGNIENLDIELKYGKLKGQTVRSLRIDSQYSNTDIQEAIENIDIESLDYGNMTFQKVDKKFRNIEAEARYGTLEINLPADASFSVEAEDQKYGKCRVKGFKQIQHDGDEDEENYLVNGGKNGNIRFEGNGYSNLFVFGL